MLEKLRNERLEKFNKARTSALIGDAPQFRYTYECIALKNRIVGFKDYKVPVYHHEYVPNPYHYQYDIELYIFLHYDELLKEELAIRSGYKDDPLVDLLAKHGPTLLSREQHLANAASIRWVGRVSPAGVFVGDLALHPWLMDFFWALSNYKNVVEFGGGGQGKTYAPLAFMCMIYDYFLFTKHGAQCTFSTVSEDKLKGSTWKYINTLYGYHDPKRRADYSLTAQRAHKAGDYEFVRFNNGKRYDEGGIIKGVLLAKGAQDTKTIDKLTGYHSPEARVYLLDEGQATDSAPLGAYNNMFLHPPYGWFAMSGNYGEEGDLLDRNTEPDLGWKSVDETTHIWEGTLKTKEESLDQPCCVIHYNNNLSPAITNPEKYAKLYSRFLPTAEKKKKQYPTEDSEKTIGHRRFWVGFKFERIRENKEYVITEDLIHDYKAHETLPKDFAHFFNIGSFDPAPESIDRNPFFVWQIGLCNDGFPMVAPMHISVYPKPKSSLEYNDITSNSIITDCTRFKIQRGHVIVDWTMKTGVPEAMGNKGFPVHGMTYNEGLAREKKQNKSTGAWEDVIMLERIPSFEKDFEKIKTFYAHERIRNKITLGAYFLRMFLEHGRIRGFNSSILTGVPCESFEKEFCKRLFVRARSGDREVISLDKKEDFIDLYGFSPDLLDTVFQFFYFIGVVYNIRPNIKGLGKLRKEEDKKRFDKPTKVWDNKALLQSRF